MTVNSTPLTSKENEPLHRAIADLFGVDVEDIQEVLPIAYLVKMQTKGDNGSVTTAVRHVELS